MITGYSNINFKTQWDSSFYIMSASYDLNIYNLLIAGSMFGILPILIIYLIFQRYLIDGMTSGAVKG